MDRLDRISLWAIVILIISSSALISHNMGEAKPDRSGQKRPVAIAVPAVNIEMDKRVKVIKALIEGNLKKAEMLDQDLIRQYPYEGEPRMLMGDIYIRKQEPVRAVLEYKEAIELNPDYLDKKTPLFQGKKLKIVVREALDDIEKKLKLSPEDESLKKERKIIYILQRRIAGSCA
jgi:tetratricopeptide (TPR) repeat protein